MSITRLRLNTPNRVRTLNSVGKARRAVRNGKDYIVAPITMVVSGVLNGSQGSLYYPPDELSNSVNLWNGTPITVNHPRDESGEPIPASTPGVLDAQGIGFIEGARVANGKLTGDGWFDMSATRRVDKRVLELVNKGKKIEISVGVDAKKHEVPEGTTYNGINYYAVARDYKPDHVAILPDGVGACSIKAGCGVFNQRGDMGKWSDWKPASDNSPTPIANDQSLGDRIDAVREAFRARYPYRYGSSGELQDYSYVCHVFNDYFIYEKANELYKQSYSVDDDGSVSITGIPESVKKVVSYVANDEVVDLLKEIKEIVCRKPISA